MLGRTASGALCSIEERSYSWTRHTGTVDWVIDHVILAKDAGLLSMIEIFGDKTCYTVGFIPESTG